MRCSSFVTPVSFRNRFQSLALPKGGKNVRARLKGDSTVRPEIFDDAALFVVTRERSGDIESSLTYDIGKVRIDACLDHDPGHF